MRRRFYETIVVSMLTGFFAFAMAHGAVAQTMSNQSIPNTGPAIEHKGPVENPIKTGSLGDAKSGVQAKEAKSMVSRNLYSQAKPRLARIARVDRSGNCLHVYAHPSIYSKEIACMLKGETIHLTGLFTKNKRWAQLDNKGWVLSRNLKTHVKPSRKLASAKSWGMPAAAGSAKSGKDRYSKPYNELNSGPIF